MLYYYFACESSSAGTYQSHFHQIFRRRLTIPPSLLPLPTNPQSTPSSHRRHTYERYWYPGQIHPPNDGRVEFNSQHRIDHPLLAPSTTISSSWWNRMEPGSSPSGNKNKNITQAATPVEPVELQAWNQSGTVSCIRQTRSNGGRRTKHEKTTWQSWEQEKHDIDDPIAGPSAIQQRQQLFRLRIKLPRGQPGGGSHFTESHLAVT